MNAKLNKILRGCSTGVVFLMVVIATLLYGTRWIGLEPYSILSPSMEPKYPTGSLIYVKEVEPTELKVKDVITFRLSNGTIATHRIVEIVDQSFRTKGDNNNTVDATLVASENVVGKTVFCIPLLGYFAQYIQTRAGNVVMICFGVAMILFVIFVDMLTDNKKSKKESKGEVGDEKN